MKDKAQEFLDYVREHKTKNTFNSYSFGLKRFLAFVGKTGTEIIQDAKKRFMSEDQQDKDYWKNKILDFKNSLTKEGLTQNSTRTNSVGAVSFFKHYGIVITLEKDFWEVQVTLSDFVPSIEQYRQLFQVGDIRTKLLISLGLDLAWRIGDVISIKRADLPALAQETPIPFEKITEKEKVIGKSFLSVETVELLKAYLPTLKPENEFLFPNGDGTSIQGQTVNDVLQNLAKKSGLKIPQGKILRFHCFRKRFLSTCADCSLDENLARILVGKAVDISMLTYLGEANLKNAWLKVKEKLTLTNGAIKSTMDSKDAEIAKLQRQLDQQNLLLQGLISAYGQDIYQKAVKKFQAETKDWPLKSRPPRIENLTELLIELGTLKTEKSKAAIQKMIDENGNGNGNH